MTFRQVAIVYCQTYKIHIRNTLFEQSTGISNLKAGGT